MATSEPLPRKKSPRAPSIALDEALDRALKVYDQERLHPAPMDLVAQYMGYKDANNGRALGALASLRYYGLLERHGGGMLSVSKDVENYKFAPNEDLGRAYLRRFLTAPPLFAELLDRHASGLPSDSDLRYELVQRNFLPGTAESLASTFRRSVEFAGVFNQPALVEVSGLSDLSIEEEAQEKPLVPVAAPAPIASSRGVIPKDNRISNATEHDRIPVRLSGGRRAWLLIPHEFHEADKARLKAQIDLLLTEDDERSGVSPV